DLDRLAVVEADPVRDYRAVACEKIRHTPSLPARLCCVNADVVHQHGLRKRRRSVRRYRGGAADGDVQQQVVVVVEDPRIAAKAGWSHRVVEGPVEEPADPVRLPVDRVGVEAVGEPGAGGELAADPAVAAVAGAVDGSVDPGGGGAEVLHH